MKLSNLPLSFIIILFVFSGCEKERKKVEIVPDLESIYVNEYIADVPAKGKTGYYEKAKKDLIDAVKTLDAAAPVKFNIAIRMFINENGDIDKIKRITGDYGQNANPDSVQIYKQNDKLMEAVASKISDWHFVPAKEGGKDVKCWTDLRATILKTPDGNYKIEMPKFLNDIPDMNDFVPVDKMPQIKKSFSPQYPEQAKRNSIEGTVYVKLFVNKEGRAAKSIVIRSDNEIFNQPALDAAAQFEFLPAVKGDKTIGVWVVVPFRFKLSK
jgi:TonB family protein